MAHIDYYLTPLSPWVYMAGTRPAEIAARNGATITYKPLDPGALFQRTGGKVLAERHESRQAYRLQELRRWSARLDMPLTLKPRHFPTNGAPASYAIIAAQAAGDGDVAALLHGLGRACWAEDRDIADDAVIRDCLAQAGFDPALADHGLLAGAETYGRNLEEGIAAGVFGMPFFVVGEERFWGQDRLDMLDEHLAGAG
ncbi:2-hydroxychromene-2-carboxylate isomerase [Alkalilacustris brevis]|uniref:2-hydroxychromene-2-carboxylate isomerase n=1 Tax=Alkalilacustris brevis TaxID=2026338 RepID=UPI000E0DE021|nr:2-hydroxychromene-2-carboxylate isomerase [Alkalilacustris brevis]